MVDWQRPLFFVSAFVSTIVSCFLFFSPASAQECDLKEVKEASKLRKILSLRAVDVVERASQPNYRTDQQLSRLVDMAATFDVGAGDVGRPLGTSIEGASSLANALRADSYRFYGWDYMDMSVDGCSTQKVTVEFIDSSEKRSAQIEFTFRAGKVVSGNGWERTFQSGSVGHAKDRQ